MSFSSSLLSMSALLRELGRPVKIMEVCGTHTMAAFRSGLRSLMPKGLSLLSGPGCPVCVTHDGYVDQSIALAHRPDVTVTTFGDMLRVPGSEKSLEQARAEGANVRVVYSPLDALQMAREYPKRKIVFLGVGFETTAPTIGWTILQAAQEKLSNYYVLCAHKTIPNAMEALLSSGEVKVDGFMCPGHVSAIIGSNAYQPISRKHGVPCVVAGFEPADMALTMEMILRQLVEKCPRVEIQYQRAVTPEGNPKAQETLKRAFVECDAEWRGLGTIPASGLAIAPKLAAHDAAPLLTGLPLPATKKHTGCRCGEVLRGVITPPECPLFRKRCTPSSPIGACMVSSEGTCAAYYKYAAVKP